jgi:hypothetical protein
LRSMPWLLWLYALPVLICACADSPRENIVDPVNAPTIEMSTPVLDGGSILIEWRYLSEGGTLSEFRVERIAGETMTNIGQLPAAATSATDWQTVTLRDSLVVAGVQVTYVVSGILEGGATSTSASRTISILGTTFQIQSDPVRSVIDVTWSGEPSGTAGYRVSRRSVGEPASIVFSTDDPTVHDFEDSDLVGNVVYVYEVATLLQGGGEMRTAEISSGVYTHLKSFSVDSPLRPGKRTLLPGSGVIADVGIQVVVASNGGVRAAEYFMSIPPAHLLTLGTSSILEAEPIELVDYDPISLSAAIPVQSHQIISPPYALYISGLNENSTKSFLAAYQQSGGVSTLTKRLDWAAMGGSKVSVTGVEAQILMIAGRTVRILDTDFNVVEMSTLESEEPIDVAEYNSSVLLAYPDRILRSNPPGPWIEIVSWDTITVPLGMHISSVATWKDLILVLDSTNGSISVLDAEGRLVVAWDAMGSNLEGGDIVTTRDNRIADIGEWILYQSDGAGGVHMFLPGGPNQED